MTHFNSLRGRLAALFERYRSMIGKSSWAVAGQAVTVVFTLGGTRLVTQYLDPGLYGTVNLAQNGVLLLRTLFCSPILNAGLRYYPEAERGHYLASFRAHLIRNLLRALIAVEVLVVAGSLYSTRRLGVAPFIIVATAIYAASDVARTLEMTLLGAAQRQRSVAFLSSFEVLIRPMLIVGAVVLFGASVSIVLGAMAASIVATLMVIYLVSDRSRDVIPGGVAIPHAIVEEMKWFAIPLIPVAAMNWATSLSDRYIIEWLTHDTASIGVYAAGYGLTSAPLMVIVGTVQSILRPVYFAAESRGDHAAAERTFRFWLLSTAGACLFAALALCVTRGYVVAAFLGPRYGSAASVIPWIALGYVFYTTEQVLEQKMLARKRSHALLIAQSAGAVTSVIVTIPLVMKYGMMGAAYACPIYFFVQCAVATAMLRVRASNAARHSELDVPS